MINTELRGDFLKHQLNDSEVSCLVVDATLVPTAAIQRGAAGTVVYVVKDDLTVTVAPVQVGPTQGETAVIDRGVAPGARVVIDGADRLREGAKVEIVARP